MADDPRRPQPFLPPRLFRALVGFTVVQGGLVLVLAIVLQQFVFTGTEAARAVRASAWLGFVVQGFTFVIARLVARDQVIAGWGVGVLLRFATVAFWGFFGATALGVPPGPALVSLVIFYFGSTLIEPLFLNA